MTVPIPPRFGSRLRRFAVSHAAPRYFLLLQYFVCLHVEQLPVGGTPPRWTTFSRLDDGVFFILKVDCVLDSYLYGGDILLDIFLCFWVILFGLFWYFKVLCWCMGLFWLWSEVGGTFFKWSCLTVTVKKWKLDMLCRSFFGTFYLGDKSR